MANPSQKIELAPASRSISDNDVFMRNLSILSSALREVGCLGSIQSYH
jgi:hypothetical protein